MASVAQRGVVQDDTCLATQSLAGATAGRRRRWRPGSLRTRTLPPNPFPCMLGIL